MDITLPLLILVLPIAMFLILGLCGMKMSHKLAGVLGTTGMGITAILAYTVAFTYFFSGNPDFVTVEGVRQQFEVFNYDWLAFTPTLIVQLGFLLDPISALMLVVITTISFFVHLYRVSNATMRSFLCLASQCLVLSLQLTSSKCISSGSLWVYRLTF